MEDLNILVNRFLFNSKPGDFYLSGGQRVEVVKRTKKRIRLSNNIIINIKILSNGLLYLDSKSVVRHNKSYPVVNQIVRDIEGYLLYKIHSKNLLD